MTYENNLREETEPLCCTREELVGLDTSTIDSLDRTEDSRYFVPINAPLFSAILVNCSVATTRERMWVAWNTRAYPKNELIIAEIIALREELAQILGFSSYAHLTIDDFMARTPEHVEEFLHEIAQKAEQKIDAELDMFKTDLPEGVVLSDTQQFKSWDLSYTRNKYIKKYFDVDRDKVAEYFPTEHTITEIMKIFEEFLNIEFQKKDLPWKWHPDVQYFAVYTKENVLLGHLLLDLYPRPGKYTHFCMTNITQGFVSSSGEKRYPVILIIANFQPKTAQKPSLLYRVSTLFHELGHTLHDLFGKTDLASFTGINVKHDFVETPSQLFEQWAYEPAIFKRLSHHYQTGESIDDETIERLKATQKLGSSLTVLSTIYASRYALALFGPGKEKDFKKLDEEFKIKPFLKHIAPDERPKGHCSSAHLIGYGAGYYSYLYSEVYALDFFAKIKDAGLDNREMADRLKETILSKGGSVDPEKLAKEFLGRPVSKEAFYRYYGFLD